MVHNKVKQVDFDLITLNVMFYFHLNNKIIWKIHVI